MTRAVCGVKTGAALPNFPLVPNKKRGAQVAGPGRMTSSCGTNTVQTGPFEGPVSYTAVSILYSCLADAHHLFCHEKFHDCSNHHEDPSESGSPSHHRIGRYDEPTEPFIAVIPLVGVRYFWFVSRASQCPKG